MKYIAAFSFVFFLSPFTFGQNTYWQQEVHYTIDVSLNDANNTLSGYETLEYFNHSPDTLSYIWFHLWPNAYKDKTSAFYKQLISLKGRKTKLKDFKDNGYIDSMAFKVNGQTAQTTQHPDYNDVVQLLLPQKLLPGGHITITTPFFVKIPSFISRMGHDGQSYMISQWYPKPAVYDRKGWHPIPYLDMGEFYSEYGSFKVNITVPSAYVVAATGVLQNDKERNLYESIGRKNKDMLAVFNTANGKPAFHLYASEENKIQKTLTYTADSVHDFAWFADKQFVINYDTLRLSSGKVIDAYTFYHPDSEKEWYNSEDFVEDAVRHYSNWVGEYLYPTVNVVEGPRNRSSGGMEYPMITLITDPHADSVNLDGVIAHEVGHNWFYGMLGTNERDHAWMDEGINTYYEFDYTAEKYRANLVLGNIIPEEIKKLDTDAFLARVYNAINQLPMKQPIETSAPAFSSEEDYSETEYLKAAIWMYTLKLSLGKDVLDKGMKAYFNDWKFKHPYPEDMQASFEASTNMGLRDLFAMLKQKGNFK